MLAKDDPERIQVSRSGENVLTEKQEKTITLVDAWNTMRGKSKEQFINTVIPPKLRKALKDRQKLSPFLQKT